MKRTEHLSYLSFLSLSILLLGAGYQAGPVPSNDPGARWGHVFIYNPVDKKIVLFGGTNKRGGVFLDDTWVWKNGAWTHLDVPGPPARGFCAVAFHQQRQSIILHGGRGKNRITYSDLWEWNGSTWTQLEQEGSYKADHHQMVYLENEQALLAFGGWDGKEVREDTWRWDGEWELLAIPSPPKRSAFSMVYNKKTDQVNLFGGLWINGQYADLWAWQEGHWSALGGPYDNSSLDHHSMIYDDSLEKVIGFGGKNYRYSMQRTTFQIEGHKIEAITEEGPEGRHSFGFTYDSDAKIGYLYGGKKYENENQIALGDFWRWKDHTWEEIE